ncbi:hypothetical protein [Pedobacter hiemivivus]|uniref:HEAT repeat domain-containing protein n=1 Tax=Pedobacter hiemivivus TaxID=2530454 RepID=A0A4R0NJS0_9SPHI|nr:hypothetical protein [Pedobacter hiemivivus]TCC99692.1 hypothetical protein EZ444_03205 [Pedobacter hiemivivus]
MSKINEIKEQLSSSKVADRKKGAKIIGKEFLKELGDDLWAAYLKQVNVANSWEAQIMMINSLGLIRYKPAKDSLYKICLDNKEHDMITSYAAMAYTRIMRTSENDISAVFDLFKFGGFSVINGALRGISADRLMPKGEEINKLISLTENFPQKHEVGLGDLRMGLACACAGWDKNLISGFLERCLTGPDKQLGYVAEKALKKKYSDINLI